MPRWVGGKSMYQIATFFILTLFLMVTACQKPAQSGDSASSSATFDKNLNLTVNYANQNVYSYQFSGKPGTYDLVLNTKKDSAESIGALSALPTYSGLDVLTIQGTFDSYKKLTLKPFHGIFIQKRDVQSAQVLTNSVLEVNGNVCSLLAQKVDLLNDHTIELSLDQITTAADIVTVKAIPHQDSQSPCYEQLTATETTPVTTVNPNQNTNTTVSFSKDISPRIVSNCTRCHSNFLSYQGVRATVWAYDINKSGLYNALGGAMAGYAPSDLRGLVATWINEGATNN